MLTEYIKNLSFTAHIAAYLESLDQTTLSNTFVYYKKVSSSFIPYRFYNWNLVDTEATMTIKE